MFSLNSIISMAIKWVKLKRRFFFQPEARKKKWNRLLSFSSSTLIKNPWSLTPFLLELYKIYFDVKLNYAKSWRIFKIKYLHKFDGFSFFLNKQNGCLLIHSLMFTILFEKCKITIFKSICFVKWTPKVGWSLNWMQKERKKKRSFHCLKWNDVTTWIEYAKGKERKKKTQRFFYLPNIMWKIIVF